MARKTLDRRSRWENRKAGKRYSYLEYFRQTLDVKGEIEFETMLIHARKCERSNHQDRIYSILDLTGDTANDSVIDYSLPVSTVAI